MKKPFGRKKELKKPIANLDFWFWAVIAYISFINFFVLKTTPEVFLLQFAILILIFRKNQLKKFSKDWVPFIGFFLLFEFLRGFADDFSPFYKHTLYWAYQIEKAIFPVIPTIFLQRQFSESHPVVNLSFVFVYTVFFYYSYLVAFLIWLNDRKTFKHYTRLFLAITFISLIFYFLMPTAPPWFIAKNSEITIKRSLYEGFASRFLRGTLLYYLFYGNPVAALPSLHVAWPMFTSLFVIRKYKRKIFWLLLIIPFAIGFSVILAGEHFLIDVLAGWALTIAVVYFSAGALIKKANRNLSFVTKKRYLFPGRKGQAIKQKGE